MARREWLIDFIVDMAEFVLDIKYDRNTISKLTDAELEHKDEALDRMYWEL